MKSRRPEFREGKPAEAVAQAVARVAEMSALIAHLHDTGARLRAEIALHLRRLDEQRQRASRLAGGEIPAHPDRPEGPASDTSSTS